MKSRIRIVSPGESPTFCICDIDCFANVKIIEYEAPHFLLYRGGRFIDIPKKKIPVERGPGNDCGISMKMLHRTNRFRADQNLRLPVVNATGELQQRHWLPSLRTTPQQSQGIRDDPQVRTGEKMTELCGSGSSVDKYASLQRQLRRGRPGKPALAAESDIRPAYNGAAADFSEVKAL